jgi:hypothetical protein
MATIQERVEIFAMSNLRSRRTGIEGVVIFVSAGRFEGKRSTHGPRIKVMLGVRVTEDTLDQAIVVSIADKPKVLVGEFPNARLQSKVFKWVIKNKDTLLDYWIGDIDTVDMVEALKKV